MLPRHPVQWYRHGDAADGANFYRALTAAPTLATDGVAVPPHLRDELGIVDITSIAAGAHNFTLVVWGYKAAVAIDLAGTLTAITDPTRGPGWTCIGGIDVVEATAGQRSAHQLQGFSGFTRLAAQVTGAAGAPAVWADFGFSPHVED